MVVDAEWETHLDHPRRKDRVDDARVLGGVPVARCRSVSGGGMLQRKEDSRVPLVENEEESADALQLVPLKARICSRDGGSSSSRENVLVG